MNLPQLILVGSDALPIVLLILGSQWIHGNLQDKNAWVDIVFTLLGMVSSVRLVA